MVCDVAVNRGQGAALRLGYRLAADHGARYIATLDADGQYDPSELPRVVDPLIRGQADLVTGSRRLGQAHTTDRLRSLGVVVFGMVITALTGRRITDPANGLRAMRIEVARAVRLEQPQYQAAELLVAAALCGFRIAEVPTTMYQRTAGSTKKGRNLGYGLRFAKVIGTTWRRDHRRVRLVDRAHAAGPAGRVGEHDQFEDHELQDEQHPVGRQVGARHQGGSLGMAAGEVRSGLVHPPG
jgi:glycosyltransferase involved in cell wall biosynthesis